MNLSITVVVLYLVSHPIGFVISPASLVMSNQASDHSVHDGISKFEVNSLFRRNAVPLVWLYEVSSDRYINPFNLTFLRRIVHLVM